LLLGAFSSAAVVRPILPDAATLGLGSDERFAEAPLRDFSLAMDASLSLLAAAVAFMPVPADWTAITGATAPSAGCRCRTINPTQVPMPKQTTAHNVKKPAKAVWLQTSFAEAAAGTEKDVFAGAGAGSDEVSTAGTYS
jgi:hypothetical protein